MDDLTFFDDDSLPGLFEGDISHIKFINSNPIMAVVCEEARSTLRVA